MEKYTVDAYGAWYGYHPTEVPAGWQILGTIRSEDSGSEGALGRLPTGIYVQIDGAHATYLDQAAVADAIAKARFN